MVLFVMVFGEYGTRSLSLFSLRFVDRLAIKKGYLEKGEVGKKGNAALHHLRAINYRYGSNSL